MKLESINWNFVINTDQLLVIKKAIGKIDEKIKEQLELSDKEYKILYDLYYEMMDSLSEISKDIKE
jgi:Mg2+ and Co2+ transporter CorA